MAEIIKTYKQSVPAMRFIGKMDPSGGGAWGEWHQKGWFDEIEKAAGGSEALKSLYEDWNAYIGLICLDNSYNTKEYWIGMFTPPGTRVPEGYRSMDYPAQNLGVCQIYGSDYADITGQFIHMQEKIKNAGMEITREEDGSFWDFDRYQCPRWTTPDEKGNIILDFCYFVK